MTTRYLLFPLLSLVISLLLTPLVRRISIKKGWMAFPTTARWHKKPTALFGGIAIYLGFSLPLFFFSDVLVFIPHLIKAGAPPPAAILPMIWAGATFLFFMGLIDDFIQIKPQTKLVGQILVASMVAFAGFRLHWFVSMTLDTLVTIFWIVGITNAFNLIDNMDGLCAGVGLVACAVWAVIFFQPFADTAVVALILAGSLGAFLIFNFNPASIFMGDCGSLVIGYVLSMMGLFYSEYLSASKLTACAVPVMVSMVPIFDTSLVTVIRLLSGRKASTGGKDHTSHRLVLMGMSEREAVLFLYGVGVIAGISGLFVTRTDSLTSPAVIVPLVLSVLLMGIYMAQLRVYPEKEFSVLRGKAYTPILMEFTHKRQISLVLLDFGLIAFAYYLAYRLRFDQQDFVYYFSVFLKSLPAVIACKFIAFYTMGVYKGFWRYISTDDVFLYLKASTLATLLSVAAVTYFFRFQDFSKGMFLIDWLLTTGMILGARGSFRISLERMQIKTLEGKSVLIYGAGRGGELLLREILNNKRRQFKPLGFIDDDALKTGKKIQGFPIFGTFENMDTLIKKLKVSGLLISFNGITSDQLEDIQQFCQTHQLFLKQFSIDIRDVDIK